MTVQRLSRLCLRVTSADDDDPADGMHLDPQKPDSFGAIRPGVMLKLLDRPCLFLACDHCEEEAEDDDRGLHFESLEELQAWAKVNNWTTDGHRFWCDGCSGDPASVERIPVIPGQIALSEAPL